MPKTLIFTKRDGEADRVLDEFARRTGLAERAGDERRIFEFEGAGHDVDALAILDDIDSAWREHVELENLPPS
jgi:hypothetical protein